MIYRDFILCNIQCDQFKMTTQSVKLKDIQTLFK